MPQQNRSILARVPAGYPGVPGIPGYPRRRVPSFRVSFARTEVQGCGIIINTHRADFTSAKE
eukprot:2382886-Rhodomonas_salina.1